MRMRILHSTAASCSAGCCNGTNFAPQGAQRKLNCLCLSVEHYWMPAESCNYVIQPRHNRRAVLLIIVGWVSESLGGGGCREKRVCVKLCPWATCTTTLQKMCDHLGQDVSFFYDGLVGYDTTPEMALQSSGQSSKFDKCEAKLKVKLFN